MPLLKSIRIIISSVAKRSGPLLSRAGRVVKQTARGGFMRASKASSALMSAVRQPVGSFASRIPGWVVKSGLVLGGGCALSTAVDLALTSVFGDSNDQSGANAALDRVRLGFLRSEPKSYYEMWTICDREGLWNYFDPGVLDVEETEPTDDTPSSGSDSARFITPSDFIDTFGAPGGPRQFSHRSVDLSYYSEVFRREVHEVVGCLNSLDGSRVDSLADRERCTRTLTRLIVSMGRLQAIGQLLMDSLEEASGYDYGAVYRVFSAALTCAALQERQLYSSVVTEQLLRHLASDRGVTSELDQKYLHFLEQVTLTADPVTANMLPLAFR